MKRVFISIISIAAALNLCACSDNSEHKSKDKEKISSKVETQEITKKETLPVDNNKYTMVDAFENITIEFRDVYPSNINFHFNTSESAYNNKIEYDCVVKTADLDKIVIEAKADYSKYEDDLKEMGYMFESDTKEYEISTDEITTNILRETQLTDENIQAILEQCEYLTDIKNIDKICVLMPKDTEFLKEYKCTDKGETGVLSSGCWEEMENKIPSNQIFVIKKSSTSGCEVYSFAAELKKGKITQCTYPDREGRRDNNGQVITETIDENSINDYFNDILEYYKSEGYSFELKEIPITKNSD